MSCRRGEWEWYYSNLHDSNKNDLSSVYMGSRSLSFPDRSRYGLEVV